MLAEGVIQAQVNNPRQKNMDVDILKLRAKRNYLRIKRVIDVVGSGLGIILLVPIYLLIAIAIKIENPKGPIIFSQTRVGLNGKLFKIFDCQIKLEFLPNT